MISPPRNRFSVWTDQLDIKAAVYPGFNIISESGSGKMNTGLVQLIYRKVMLQVYDNYLNNHQYRCLKKAMPDEKNTKSENFRPDIIFPLPMITARIYKSHIVTEESRLRFLVDDEKIQKALDDLIEDIQLWSILDTALPSYFALGSMFIYFSQKSNGDIILRFFNSKYCYPKFDSDGELESVKVRYIYETEDINPRTKQPLWRWFQYKFGPDADITYDEPIFDVSQAEIPTFKQTGIVKHGAGYVRGEWIKTSHALHSNDGESMLENKLEELDKMNYMLSGIWGSSITNLYPPLFSKGIDAQSLATEMQSIRRKGITSPGADLIVAPGGEADLHYLEPALAGIQNALAYNAEYFQYIQHMFSTVLLNPEAVAPHANSGRALESLYKPVVQYINCRRPLLKKGICNLMEKIEPFVKDIPDGTIKKSNKQWGSVFSDTLDDEGKKITNVLNLHGSQLLSTETALENIKDILGIKNVQEELGKIKSEREEQRVDELEDQQLLYSMQQPQQSQQQQPKPNPKATKK